MLVLVLAAIMQLSFGAQLRMAGGPAAAKSSPAPAPMGSPSGAPGPALTPLEVVEEAHHSTAVATTDHVLDESKKALKEASIAHSQAGVHVAEAEGDHDAKKEYQDKIKDHTEDLKKLQQKADASKATLQATTASYKNAEKVADAHEEKAHETKDVETKKEATKKEVGTKKDDAAKAHETKDVETKKEATKKEVDTKKEDAAKAPETKKNTMPTLPPVPDAPDADSKKAQGR